MRINSQSINQIDTSKLSIFVPNKKLAVALAKKDRVDFVYKDRKSVV